MRIVLRADIWKWYHLPMHWWVNPWLVNKLWAAAIEQSNFSKLSTSLLIIKFCLEVQVFQFFCPLLLEVVRIQNHLVSKIPMCIKIVLRFSWQMALVTFFTNQYSLHLLSFFKLLLDFACLCDGAACEFG